MISMKNSRMNPLQVMSKAAKPPVSAVESHIDKCNELLGRAGASLEERANVLATDGKSSVPKMLRRSRGGHRTTRISPEEPRREADADSFETKLKDTANTRRRVKGKQEELLVGFKDSDKERNHRRHSEKLVVDFPSEHTRTRRAHRSIATSWTKGPTSESAKARRAHRSMATSWTKGSREPTLENSIRTADTELSFEDAINDPDSYVREIRKKKEKKGKKQTPGDLADQFDWSESSIVWGDEECSSDEESSNSQVCNFSSTIFTSRSSSGGGERSIVSCNGRRRPRDPACSRSFMDLSFRSTDSCPSNFLWQSFSSMNVSRKKLEP
jgi:hypothetical protein